MAACVCERVWENPAVYRIRLPFSNLGEGESNCFVLHDDGAWLIVDTGASTVTGRRRLAGALAALGVDFSRCAAFATHAHFDHAGLIDDVLPRSVEVCMSQEGFAARTPEGERAAHDLFLRRMTACGVPFEDACAYAAGNAEAVRLDAAVRPYRFVRPGDTVAVGSTTLRVIDTAGHTADHLALYDERRGLLFSGDHVLFDVAPSVDAYPGARDGLGIYAANLHAMRDLPVRVAFPGHGDAIRQGFAERACAIAQKKMRRCERALYAVQEYPGLTGAALARRVFARRAPEQWRALPPLSRYYFLLETFVCLQHLHAQGRIERTLGNDGVWHYAACR